MCKKCSIAGINLHQPLVLEDELGTTPHELIPELETSIESEPVNRSNTAKSINQMTNKIFYVMYPHLKDKTLTRATPGYEKLKADWLRIRDRFLASRQQDGSQVRHAAAGATKSAVSGISTSLAAIVTREWLRWGKGARTEDEKEMQTVIRQYYQDAQLKLGKSFDPWSAVFISWAARQAGAGPAFAYGHAHTTYAYAAIQNRLKNTGSVKGYRISEIAPQVGDIVVRNRDGNRYTYDTVKPNTAGTHGDVVVNVKPGVIEVIGGNKSNSKSDTRGVTVNKSIIKTDGKGMIINPAYFVIVRFK